MQFEPLLRFSIPELEISMSVGLRYGDLIGSATTYKTHFNNTSDITIEESIEYTSHNNILGFSVGLQYELMTALFGNNNRIKVSPLLNYSHIPRYFETFGAIATNNSIRLGFIVSIGSDIISYDTLEYQSEQGIFITKGRAKSAELISIEKLELIKRNETKIDNTKQDFAESQPVNDYQLNKSTVDYLNDLLHITKSNENAIIEIVIIKPIDHKNDSNNSLKVLAIIDHLKRNGIKDEKIKRTIVINNATNKTKVEINIINN